MVASIFVVLLQTWAVHRITNVCMLMWVLVVFPWEDT